MAILERTFAGAERNDPCPCGSGRKFKQCHGQAQPKPGNADLPSPQARSAAKQGGTGGTSSDRPNGSFSS
jgi:hypothetical protein